jgi:integrase
VRKRADGRYMVEISLGYENGRRVRAYAYGATIADANRAALKLRAQIERGDRPGKKAEAPRTVAQLLDRWIETVRANRTPATTRNYENQIKLHIKPRIGSLSLARVTSSTIESMLADMAKVVGPRTVRKAYQTLSAAYSYAIRMELVARNPITPVQAPTYKAPERRPFSMDEARNFLAAIAGDPNAAIYLIAIFTGLGPAEIFGLQRGDVDLEHATISVRNNLVRAKKTKILAPTKVERRRRSVYIVPIVAAAIKQHLERLDAAGVASSYVFPGAKGGAASIDTWPRKHFFPLLERAELPRIRFYDLRHTAATMLFAIGTHPKIVQELLGHSQISTTMNTYSHAIPSMQADAMRNLARALEPDRSRSNQPVKAPVKKRMRR